MSATDRAGATVRRLGPSDLIPLASTGLAARPVRAILSALGVMIAIATLVAVTSVPASSRAALDARLTALGADLLRADPVTGDPPVTLPPRSAGMLRRIGPVRDAAVVKNVHAPVRRSELQPDADSGLTTLAVSGPLLTIVRGRLSGGHWMSRGSLPTVVLGSHAADRLGFPRLPRRTVTIDVGGTRFAVVGVLAPTPLSADLESAVLVTDAAARRWLHSDGHPTAAYLTAAESSIGEIRPVVAATLSPEAPGRVLVSRPSAVLAAKHETARSFDGLFLGLASVALLVGGVGVANTMFVTVWERRREIGMRRALGATRGQIRAQFLGEAILLCCVGGAAGTLVGIASSAVWAFHSGWPLVVPASAVLIGLAASVATGILGGLGPSVRAARQSPVIALGSE